MQMNLIKCSINPSNLVAPVKVNERFVTSKEFERKSDDFCFNFLKNNTKIKETHNLFDKLESIDDEYITSKRSFIKVLVPPHIVRYSHLNKK